VLLPLDARFQEACTRAAPSWWAPDGVHPSAAGHGLIADAWLATV
jgi:lysophospholipase L1-like esterase